MRKIKKEPTKAAKKLVRIACFAAERATKAIRLRSRTRKDAVLVLIGEGFSFREIGELLGITGQRVGALVRYWSLQ